MSHQLFAVSRFKNRNGVYSFRVEGCLNGVRIRRNFKTQEEASAERATLELKAMQATTDGLQSAATFLATDQLREAEAAFHRLQDGPRSLTFYLNYAHLQKDGTLAKRHQLDSMARGTLGAKNRCQ